jgi:hypothetical protein
MLASFISFYGSFIITHPSWWWWESVFQASSIELVMTCHPAISDHLRTGATRCDSSKPNAKTRPVDDTLLGSVTDRFALSNQDRRLVTWHFPTPFS